VRGELADTVVENEISLDTCVGKENITY